MQKNKSDTTSHWKKIQVEWQLQARVGFEEAVQQFTFHARRFKRVSAKAQRWQKCPPSFKIVDRVNKKCQLRLRVEGGVCWGWRSGWSVQNVDRDRKWPGNWTRDTNEPVPERLKHLTGLKSVLQVQLIQWKSEHSLWANFSLFRMLQLHCLTGVIAGQIRKENSINVSGNNVLQNNVNKNNIKKNDISARRFDPYAGSFCVEFACSPCVCVGSVQVFWLPLTVQKDACPIDRKGLNWP